VFDGLTLVAVPPHVPTFVSRPLRLAVVVPATGLIALEGALIIKAAIGVSANDAVTLGLVRVLLAPANPRPPPA
jgi:hypothetical protein